MQKNVMKSIIALESKMARLKQKTLKLAREEYSKNESKDDESLEITIEKITCPTCRGDGKDSSTIHIQDLCSADRKKITQLIAELARCTQEKHKVTADLAVSKAENEALQNQFQLLNSQHEDEKNRLRSELSSTRTELNKLKLQTSYSLGLLTEQIIALESQSMRLIATVKDLLTEKISLQDVLMQEKTKIQILEARVDKLKNNENAEKILLQNEQIKNQPKKCEKDCQTKFDENLNEVRECFGFKISKANSVSRGFQKTIQPKGKHDLDEPSTEAILIRELFFKRPSIDENEGLDLFPKLPTS